MMEYEILCEPTTKQLVFEVNKYIRMGWNTTAEAMSHIYTEEHGTEYYKEMMKYD